MPCSSSFFRCRDATDSQCSHVLVAAGINRNFIFQSLLHEPFSKYSFCHRRTTEMLPRQTNTTFMTVPRFPFFPFTITYEPPLRKNVCVVLSLLERTKFSKNIPVESKTRFLQILAGFFIIAVMGAPAVSYVSSTFEIQTDSKRVRNFRMLSHITSIIKSA